MSKKFVWAVQIVGFLIFLWIWGILSYYLFLIFAGIISVFGVPDDNARAVSSVLVWAMPLCVFAVWMMRRLNIGKPRKIKEEIDKVSTPED